MYPFRHVKKRSNISHSGSQQRIRNSISYYKQKGTSIILIPSRHRQWLQLLGNNNRKRQSVELQGRASLYCLPSKQSCNKPDQDDCNVRTILIALLSIGLGYTCRFVNVQRLCLLHCILFSAYLFQILAIRPKASSIGCFIRFLFFSNRIMDSIWTRNLHFDLD